MSKQLALVSQVRRWARAGVARQIREEAGIGLRELAAALGVQPSTLLRWESGVHAPSHRNAIRWGHILTALQTAATSDVIAAPTLPPPSPPTHDANRPGRRPQRASNKKKERN